MKPKCARNATVGHIFSSQTFKKTHVFLDTRSSFLLASAIGNFIAQYRSQARIFNSFSNHIQ